MKEDYEGQGLELLFRILWVFAAIGVVSVIGWALYALDGEPPVSTPPHPSAQQSRCRSRWRWRAMCWDRCPRR